MNPPGRAAAGFNMSDWTTDGKSPLTQNSFIGDLVSFALYRFITTGAGLALEAEASTRAPVPTSRELASEGKRGEEGEGKEAGEELKKNAVGAGP